jgi:hypothetical protein
MCIDFCEECTGGPLAGGRRWRWRRIAGKGARCSSIDVLTSNPAQRQHDTGGEEQCRHGRSGVILRKQSSRSAAGSKPCMEGFGENASTPRAFGSSNGDIVLAYRGPLSARTPHMREFEPGCALRLALETRVLDGRTNGGGRVRSLVGCQSCTRELIRKRPGK